MLDQSSKKSICPACEKKRFVRCVNQETGDYYPDKFGRCDREAECGYSLYPGSDDRDVVPMPASRPKQPHTKAYIPKEVLQKTLTGYENNTFVNNLLYNIDYPFLVADVEAAIGHFCLGTVVNGYRSGALIIPFIDHLQRICAVQVKGFDKGNHTISTDFLHSIIQKHFEKKGKPLPDWLEAYNKNDLKVSCLFGEHNLDRYPTNRINLVEAPKTALYGTLYFGLPDNPENPLWLAVYNLSSINYEKLKVLKGRNVTLFPDLSRTGKAFNLWSTKAKELAAKMPGTTFRVSDLLEKNATEEQRDQGQDLADFLQKLDWRHFRKDVQPTFEKVEAIVEKVFEAGKVAFQMRPYTDRESFDSILRDLDNGGTWEIIARQDEWRKKRDIGSLKEFFYKLSTKYVTALTTAQKQAFIHERHQAGFTKAGIAELFPSLRIFNQ